jgi:hypothetical protein
MIKVRHHLVGRLHVNEYLFARTVFKPDVFKIATYRHYLGSSKPFMREHVSYTLETDLSRDEEVIFKSFNADARTKIRRTGRLNFLLGINDVPEEEYIEFFNSFARVKRLAIESKKRLSEYKKENIIFTSARDRLTSELLVVHVYVVDGERARLLHSASQIHDMEDGEKRKLVGLFNRRLHWEEMLYFKKLGYSIYDWGGYSRKHDNKVLMGINDFKKSFGGIEREVINYHSYLYEVIVFLAKIKRKVLLAWYDFRR